MVDLAITPDLADTTDQPVVVGCEYELGVSVMPPTAIKAWESAGGMLLHVGGPAVGTCHCCQFLRNGSRLYLDCGQHLEYATPECSNARELVAADAGGMGLLARMAERAEQVLSEQEGYPVRVRVIRNNVSLNGECWGAHENYQVPRELSWTSIADELASHLASRIVYTGAGTVIDPLLPGFVNGYRISQRAPFVSAVLSTSAVRPDGGKPMVMARDEPLADPGRYRRVQVVCGDANMSQVATWLKIGATAIGLRLIAARMAPAIVLDDAVGALRSFASDTSLLLTVGTSRGAYRALDIQECWIEAAERYAGRHGLDEHDRSLLDAWQRVIVDLRADVESAADRVDWVAKRQLLRADEEHRRRGATSSGDGAAMRSAALDLTYHDVSRRRSAFAMWAASRHMGRLVDDDTARWFEDHPPTTTRAQLRGRLIDVLSTANVAHVMNWAACDILLGASPVRLRFEDALQTDDTESNPVVTIAGELLTSGQPKAVEAANAVNAANLQRSPFVPPWGPPAASAPSAVAS